MHGAKEIIEEAGSLPVEERVFVINSLLLSLNPANAARDRRWAKLARKRLAELRSGRVKAVPGSAVFAQAWKRLGK